MCLAQRPHFSLPIQLLCSLCGGRLSTEPERWRYVSIEAYGILIEGVNPRCHHHRQTFSPCNASVLYLSTLKLSHIYLSACLYSLPRPINASAARDLAPPGRRHGRRVRRREAARHLKTQRRRAARRDATRRKRGAGDACILSLHRGAQIVADHLNKTVIWLSKAMVVAAKTVARISSPLYRRS